MGILIWAVVVATSAWVAIDASKLGVRRGGLGGGFNDVGPVSWFFACLLIWLIGFTAYLITRPRYVAAAAARAGSPSPGNGPTLAGQPTLSPAYGAPQPSNAHLPAAQVSGWGRDHEPQTAAPVPDASLPLAEQLAKLARSHQSGLLTDEEFRAAKENLLRPGA